MTLTFECNGCGKSLPFESMYGTHATTEEVDEDGITEVNIHTCEDCWDAFEQFLEDRYNNSTKGINTGKRKK